VQPLSASPRASLTAAQVTALLTAPDLATDFGVELLDASLALVEDISADVVTGTVRRDNLATVHGTVDLTVTRSLAWGRDRVRPYMLLSSATAGVSLARFNLGVFLLTTPSTPLTETPITYAVTGFDQLNLLQDSIGDSYSVALGANVLTSVRAALTAAGVTAPVLLDSAASTAVLSSVLTFPLTSSSSPTWIQVVNGLLASVNYWGIWTDWDGAFRSGPYVTPAARAPEWTFTVGDLVTGVVATERTVTNDVWNAPNWWRFIQNGLTSAPVEGAGQYTVQNVTAGPSAQGSVGRTVHAPVVFLDAVDQASLVSQGDRVVAAALRSTEIITTKLSPFPIAWHQDIVAYVDAALGGSRKASCRSWALPLGGADGDYILESVR
jgi:hypothetical protein